jgi:hypothetical protein
MRFINPSLFPRSFIGEDFWCKFGAVVYHVLAAAIRVTAQTIVTFNLSDFSKQLTAKYEVDIQHPNEFLRHLIDLLPAKVIQTVRETRLSLKNPSKTTVEYLAILKQQSLPRTVMLRDAAERSYRQPLSDA